MQYINLMLYKCKNIYIHISSIYIYEMIPHSLAKVNYIVFFLRIFYDIEFGRVIDVLQGHEDAVSCLAWSSIHQVIISGSWDCTVKVWHGYTSGSKIKPAECFIAQLDHDSKVTCINISR